MTTKPYQDIHEWVYKFVIRVLLLIKKLPKTPENLIIINQITRSSTSMGANDREADGVSSKRDFIHTYTIVRKEGKETDYWLNIIGDTNEGFKFESKALAKECVEIIKIVSTIIYNTQKHS